MYSNAGETEKKISITFIAFGNVNVAQMTDWPAMLPPPYGGHITQFKATNCNKLKRAH